jgi:outer membrane biosynthesis protein TonB
MTDNFDPYKDWLGIEPHERPANHYRLLGLELFNANPDDVRRAAETRMQLLRSYQSGPRGKHTQKLLNEISAAKLCLLDDNTRITYDAALQGALSAVDQPLPEPPVPRRNRTKSEPETSKGPAPPPPPTQRFNPTVKTPSPTAVAGSESESRPQQPPPPPAKITKSSSKSARASSKQNTIWEEKWFLPTVIGGLISLALIGVLAVVVTRPNDVAEQTEPEKTEPPDPPKENNPPAEQPPAADLPPLVAEKADGSVMLFARDAMLTQSLEIKSLAGGDVISGWLDTNETATWRFKIDQPAVYKLKIEYAASEGAEVGRLRATIGRMKKSQSLRAKGEDTFVKDEIFLPVTKTGEHRLVIEVEKLSGNTFFLQSIEMIPTGGS